MRLGILTIVIFFAGNFFAAYKASAGVIKSTDTLRSNYEMHHRVIIYDNLSSYRNVHRKTLDDKQKMINRLYFSNDTFEHKKNKSIGVNKLERINLTQFPISTSMLATPYIYTSKDRARLFLENDQGGNYMEMPVGSFLDSFKDDPLLRTIYFTSKDIIFSYRRKIANVLQLGFDVKANDYQYSNDSWKIQQEAAKRQLSQTDRHNIKPEDGRLFWLISEAYETALYAILAILATLYISFRYFLNKYI